MGKEAFLKQYEAAHGNVLVVRLDNEEEGRRDGACPEMVNGHPHHSY